MKREDILKNHIPESYSPGWHVAACVASTAATLGVGLWKLNAVRPAHIATAVGTWAIANAGEYFLHRFPFHHRWKGPASGLYERHTVMHHNLYDHETMPYESTRELRWVLLPAWGFPAVLAIMSPTIGALYMLGPNHAWMFLVGIASYYGVYELLHTASHLPKDSWLAKSGFVKWATEHHRVHHNPKLMQKFNFSFALPFLDKLFGTQYHEERAAKKTPVSEVVGDAAQRAS